jgi:tetratricopeptide (TPR) repeat protein
VEDAHRLAERLLALSRDRKERGNQAWALWLLGEIAAQRHPPDAEQAEAHYRQALTLVEELGMRPLVAHCHAGLGTLSTQTGRSEQARTELSMAIALYRAMAMTFWVPQTEAALAQVDTEDEKFLRHIALPKLPVRGSEGRRLEDYTQCLRRCF